MAHRVLELTVVSASDLKDVNWFSRMEVYAVASVSGDPLTRQCTHTDRCGGTNPTWDETVRLAVPPTAAAASAAGAFLHVLLRTERALGEDRDVGEVVVPLADLLLAPAGACDDGGPRQRASSSSYQVRKVHCAKHRGMLRLSYRLGPVMAPVDFLLPAAAERCEDYKYPSYQVTAPYYIPYYVYPPAYQVVPRYPPAPAAKTAGCARGAATPSPKNIRKGGSFGLGLIGGMLVGDMMSSDTEAYDVVGHGSL